MARWDEILNLPVQSPPTLEFSASDVVWSKVEGWRDNIDRVALIPFARVDDFIRGESSNKDCPTGFHVEARRHRSAKASYKVKVDGVLEYILYWCSFGPDDHRKGGIVRPSRNTYIPKKKSAGRPGTKRGCTCHFIVKRLIARPSVALIIYNQDKHVDKSGLPCHGPQDKKAAGTRAMYAPYISDDLRLRVHSLLYVGVPVETIMQRHNESVEKQGGPFNRDDLLTHRYVRRQEKRIRRYKYELDADDAVSLSLWVANHPTCVFFYQDFSESEPFTVGIQTEWQLQQMIRFGNRGLLASDSRFGTNKFKYPVHSLLVFNSENKAIPIAWVISPRFTSRDAFKWIRALHNRVLTKDPAWKLAGFVIDDPLTDTGAIRDIFECSVLISTWRIRHALHKALMKRCSQTEMRVQISQRLGQVISEICTGQGDVTLFDGLMEDFTSNSEFMEYFKAVWYPRIGFWATSLQTLPLASQEMSAAIEFYHCQMNVRVLNEMDHSAYQRVDWLVDKLSTQVHSYLWLDECPAKHDFARYWRDEWMDGLTSWRNSLKIPDSDVILEGQFAKVIDQQDQDKIYLVSNPGSEFSICNCTVSESGNLCEHVCKVSWLCRKKKSSIPSLSLHQYKQALIKMLCCTPHDSLIRDHAVSLSAFLQTQLNALADFDSSERNINEIEQQAGFTMSLDNNISLAIGQQGHTVVLSNANSRLLSKGSVEKGSCNDGAFHDEMEIDPSSICISPSGLFAMHGILPADSLSVNGDKTLLSDSRGMMDNEASKDCDTSDQVDPDVMMEESLSIDIPLSKESQDLCSVINHDYDDCGDKVAGAVDSIDDNTVLKFYKRSKTAKTVGRHPAKKRKTTDKEDMRKEI
ncbi:uncharacterized protein LOC110714646 [Chenopodium quinoa]|uniref:SWIM-type domain-containing protein n=1 Tax=Chenopodium quinoa TaxID=63459 RepID=A0A803KYM0_CHEQI|nr:uncharacterized protein LOC110714646 [Chenopodium quinoa]